MKIEQAFFGERSNSHSFLLSSFRHESLFLQLLPLTDKPGAIDLLKPYFSGYYFDDYYVFVKTMPDPDATRRGMVFSHCLIISINDISELNNLSELIGLFINDPDKSRSHLETLVVDEGKIKSLPVPDEFGSFNNVYNSLVSEDKTLVWKGEDQFIELLNSLWSSFTLALRKNLKFRLSASPSDIENKNYTIVNIPEDKAILWSGYKIVNFADSYQELSREAKYLYAPSLNPEFSSFVSELGVEVRRPSKLKELFSCFDLYILSKNSTDIMTLNRTLRKIGVLKPDKLEAHEIKQDVLHKFAGFLEQSDCGQIISVRTLNLEPFKGGQELIQSAISSWCSDNFQPGSKESISSVAKFLNHVYNDKNPRWWEDTIKSALAINLKSVNTELALFLYELWKKSPELVGKMSTLITTGEEFFVSIFEKYNDLNLRDNILDLAWQKKWFVLHAVCLYHLYDDVELIKRQTDFENWKNDSLGLRKLVSLIGFKDFFQSSLLLGDEQLMKFVADRFIEEGDSLELIDVSNVNCQRVWFLSLQKTKDVNFGISAPQLLLFQIFDRILSEQTVINELLNFFTDTQFSNIIDYPQRKFIWSKLNDGIRQSFLESTCWAIIKNFSIYMINDLESELLSHLSSNIFRNNVLSSHEFSIENKLSYLTVMNRLDEEQLIHLINVNVDNIVESEAIQIGRVILDKRWRGAANRVYELRWKNYKLEQAVSICRDLYGWVKRVLIKPDESSQVTIEGTIDTYSSDAHTLMFKPKVFISYNHKDQEIALEIQKRLVGENIEAIIDVDAMVSGENIKKFIERCIKESGITLSLVSRNSLLSSWVSMETMLSIDDMNIRGRHFLPCNITMDIFDRRFVDSALDEVDKELTEIDDIISDRLAKNRGIEDLEKERSRYRRLQTEISNIVAQIKESLCVNLSGENFEDGIEKIITDIKYNCR